VSSPRILAGVNICVTDDPAAARQRADEQLALYGTLPAYRAMLDAERVAAREDLLNAGDETTVSEGLQAYGHAGGTDVRVSRLDGFATRIETTEWARVSARRAPLPRRDLNDPRRGSSIGGVIPGRRRPGRNSGRRPLPTETRRLAY